MQIIFNKYHGAGNDFIIADNRQQVLDPDNETLIRHMCDRHFGIGADGLILLYDHAGHDFEMEYFNADGRKSTMCGNGGRCAVAFALKHGISRNKNTFLAPDGVHSYREKDNIITISMLDTMPPVEINGRNFLNTGSPHYIIDVPDNSKTDVYSKGKEVRWSDDFAPGGTNVNFVEHRDDEIYVRTFERGVEDETLSCGTGVTASAISDKWDNGPGKYKVNVSTPGGKLSVDFEITDKMIKGIYLTGPAEFVFSGVYE